MKKCIGALVLAAGASVRMGQPKQLLPYGRATVLQTVVDAVVASGVIETICVVLGHKSKAVARSLAGRPISLCVNPDPARGMFSSVLQGLAAMPAGTDATLVVLGDQPRISADIVCRVVDAYRTSGKGIIVPSSGGRRGHPPLIDLGRYGDRIRGLDGTAGLKPIVRGFPEDTMTLDVQDCGVLMDIDTPAQYQKALRGLRGSGGAAENG